MEEGLPAKPRWKSHGPAILPLSLCPHPQSVVVGAGLWEVTWWGIPLTLKGRFPYSMASVQNMLFIPFTLSKMNCRLVFFSNRPYKAVWIPSHTLVRNRGVPSIGRGPCCQWPLDALSHRLRLASMAYTSSRGHPEDAAQWEGALEKYFFFLYLLFLKETLT